MNAGPITRTYRCAETSYSDSIFDSERSEDVYCPSWPISFLRCNPKRVHFSTGGVTLFEKNCQRFQYFFFLQKMPMYLVLFLLISWLFWLRGRKTTPRLYNRYTSTQSSFVLIAVVYQCFQRINLTVLWLVNMPIYKKKNIYFIRRKKIVFIIIV